MKIAIFHGNEKWVLRGLAIDVERALSRLGIDVSRHEVDLRRPGPVPDADFFFFVQQGQLKSILAAWDYRHELVVKSVCIFTHYDAANCDAALLNRIRLVSHMSSHQMAISIANGLSPHNSRVLTLGVELNRHYPVKQSYLSQQLNSIYSGVCITQKRSYIGFCTRYWMKNTYIKRKNYDCLLRIVQKLAAAGENILILGDGWSQSNLPADLPGIVALSPPYEHYNFFYNLMSLFVSVTSYDGGPIPLLEAMACGVPAVMTNSGFAPDIITNDDYGILFQPFADDSIVMKCIAQARNRQYDRTFLRARASLYSFDQYAGRLVRLLSS